MSAPITIQNQLGLHARAAAAFVKIAFRFRSEIELIEGRKRVNGKSIMGLLTLAAAQGTKLTLRAKGPDAAKAVAALTELVNNKFGEG